MIIDFKGVERITTCYHEYRLSNISDVNEMLDKFKYISYKISRDNLIINVFRIEECELGTSIAIKIIDLDGNVFYIKDRFYKSFNIVKELS